MSEIGKRIWDKQYEEFGEIKDVAYGAITIRYDDGVELTKTVNWNDIEDEQD